MNTNDFIVHAIEKDIPIIEKKSSRYPLKQMQVGDSFLVECDDNDRYYVASIAISAARQKRLTYFKDKKFISRFVNGGVRIWRVK